MILMERTLFELKNNISDWEQARRQLNWNEGGMDSQYKLLSELLSDQAAFITSPKTSLANYWGALPPAPPVSTGLRCPSNTHFQHINRRRQQETIRIPG